MSLVVGYKSLLKTKKNGIQYEIFKRTEMPATSDDSFITFSISTIEAVLLKSGKKEQLPEAPFTTTRFAIHDGFECVQIVATSDMSQTMRCLYWAKGGECFTGMAVMSKCTFPSFQITTYGSFPEMMKGTHPYDSQRTTLTTRV